MFKKIKRLMRSDSKKSSKELEIKPIFEGNSMRVAVFENGKEINWDALLMKEQAEYSKILDKQYIDSKVPLSEFTPKVAAKETIEEYHYPLADIDFLINALKDWEQCPESHPAIEKWYRDGCPEIERPKMQWEIDFEEYFPVFEEARALWESDPVAALEKYVYILENYRPTGTAYYTEPTELFCRHCRYNEAMFSIVRLKENYMIAGVDAWDLVADEYSDIMRSIEVQEDIFNRVLGFVTDNPGVIQSELYKKLNVDGRKARFVIYNMDKSGYLEREKYKNSYKLFPTGKAIHKDYIIGF